MKKIVFIFFLLFSAFSLNAQTKRSTTPPHLEAVNGVKRLIVEDKPFLVLGGELFNSSSSSLQYMDSIWSGLVKLNLNTVLAGVSWELVEPQEGQFNFDLIDGLIKDARKHNLKIVFLWFASWKNMVSTYVPGWVKNNPERFPLLIAGNGERYQMLSTFSQENVQADAQAFAALMKHIKQVDSNEQTVIMMQVENEVGTNGGERDYSKAATKVYESEVPKQLMSYLQKNKSSLIPELKQVWSEGGYRTTGTWKEIFGESGAANEIFMAWHLGSYIGKVIEAGKKEYNIPMFVNAAIGRQNQKLGTYPSGGPLPFVMDVWYAAAPKLDMLCPDIYFGDFTGHCQKYTQSGNPLFIPETFAGDRGAANALLAYANFNAIGFSPFGIDKSIGSPTGDISLSQLYGVMGQLSTFVLNSEAKKQMIAVSLDTAHATTSIELGAYQVDFDLRVSRWENEKPGLGYAILIEVKPDEFIAAGKNVSIQFSQKDSKDKVTGILWAEEGRFENETWLPGRRLNGDEIMVDYWFSKLFKEGKSGNGLKFNSSLNIQKVKLYSY
jgi:hypothetical protein